MVLMIMRFNLRIIHGKKMKIKELVGGSADDEPLSRLNLVVV